jgi:hypothetical protein
MGIHIFESVQEALRAGYTIESPIPDSEGFLHARTRTRGGWAQALVRTKPSDFGVANVARPAFERGLN